MLSNPGGWELDLPGSRRGRLSTNGSRKTAPTPETGKASLSARPESAGTGADINTYIPSTWNLYLAVL